MKKTLLSILLLVPIALLFSQTGQRIDGAFEFQTDNAKKYSLYIPSNYDETQPQKLMLGLHPFNTSRWDAKAWRDTLLTFAETNDLLLVCPDGGADGKVDDAIDTAFTSVLLDSVRTWYSINEAEKYIMGFSWGGKTTYTYGLRRTAQFKGYLVIGAAVNINEVSPIMEMAKDENFYLLHGANDNTGTRFTPLLNALEQNGACVESQLLNGVGHTIDFVNRNNLLTQAFEYLETNNCGTSSTLTQDTATIPLLYPNPFSHTLYATHLDLSNTHINIYNNMGQAVPFELTNHKLIVKGETKGLLYIKMTRNGTTNIQRIVRH